VKLFEQGRKFALSAVFMVQGLAIVAFSGVLALKGKLTAEWVSLITIWLPMAAAGTIAFSASNAYVSGKAIEAGQEAPANEGGPKTR
jgi:uncharacterized membrane protein YebE (DUF533 family)